MCDTGSHTARLIDDDLSAAGNFSSASKFYIEIHSPNISIVGNATFSYLFIIIILFLRRVVGAHGVIDKLG